MESVKQHLPADIFHREQDAAVISLRTARQMQESTERSLPAVKSASTSYCYSRGEKRTDVNRNRLKYTAVIISVFSYP